MQITWLIFLSIATLLWGQNQLQKHTLAGESLLKWASELNVSTTITGTIALCCVWNKTVTKQGIIPAMQLTGLEFAERITMAQTVPHSVKSLTTRWAGFTLAMKTMAPLFAIRASLGILAQKVSNAYLWLQSHHKDNSSTNGCPQIRLSF